LPCRIALVAARWKTQAELKGISMGEPTRTIKRRVSLPLDLWERVIRSVKALAVCSKESLTIVAAPSENAVAENLSCRVLP
jgi:hypothetical protein